MESLKKHNSYMYVNIVFLSRLTLKIAWSVRRWRSVNTKRGFLGCCGWSGESSFLLQAEKYRKTAFFQQDSWNFFFIRSPLLPAGWLLSLKNGCLGFNFLSCPSVTKCTSFFFLTNSIVDRIFLYQSCLSLPTI